MKKLLLITLVGLIASSCSTFDKWKTPTSSNAGLAPGEKSSYLLNKPDSISAPDVNTAKTTIKKKKKKTDIKSSTPKK